MNDTPHVTPRPEYPRPALVRPEWSCLNGEWELAYDADDRGLREGWECGRSFDRRVVVPYPLESERSGVADSKPPPIVWYRRLFECQDAWRAGRVALRIGACDYETRVFVNGRGVGEHRGGYAPFACEVGHALRSGANEVVLRVADPPTWTRPRGKQVAGAFRTPIDYDTVTGVWQSVWLEPLPEVSVDAVWTRFERASGTLAVHVAFSEPWAGDVEVVLEDGGAELGGARRGALGRPETRLLLEPTSPELWSPDTPRLYDLRARLLDGEGVVDEVTSYAGLREVSVEGGRLLLNGEPLYLRGVLDQGYFPGGWYTAPEDRDLRRDVELTKALGFNCARKHQKAEDPRYLYWADRLGLLVWSEMPSGRDFTTELATTVASEWVELVRRDRGHPSVIAWVPFNESWGVWNQAERPEERALVEGLVGLTKALDPTRPVVGNDGWEYSAGDLWTLHLYEGETDNVGAHLERVLADPHSEVVPDASPIGPRVGALAGVDVSGLPVLLTECGGVGYLAPGQPKPDGLFSYGDLPDTPEELARRLRAVAETVSSSSALSGFVWTQLTDVQQEVNGLLTFDREPKLPFEVLSAIFSTTGRP